MTTATSSVGRPRTRVGRPLRAIVASIWLPLVLVVAWWFASADSTDVYFPPLSRIWDAMLAGFANGTIPAGLAYSVTNIIVGLLTGTVVAIVVGVVIAENPLLRRVLDPFLQFARSVPQSALVPIVIGALGIGQAPKVYLIAFACSWPVLLNTIDGVRSILPEVRDLAQAYRIPTLLAIRRVVLPSALPQIVAGIRISLAVAVVIMVVSELFSSTSGIGHFIYLAGNRFDMASAWAGTLIVAALGYLLSLAFSAFERLTLGWYFESASQSHGRRARSKPLWRRG